MKTEQFWSSILQASAAQRQKKFMGTRMAIWTPPPMAVSIPTEPAVSMAASLPTWQMSDMRSWYFADMSWTQSAHSWTYLRISWIIEVSFWKKCSSPTGLYCRPFLTILQRCSLPSNFDEGQSSQWHRAAPAMAGSLQNLPPHQRLTCQRHRRYGLSM